MGSALARRRRALPWLASGLASGLAVMAGGLDGFLPADSGDLRTAGAAAASLRFPKDERPRPAGATPDDPARSHRPEPAPPFVGPDAPWEAYDGFRGPPDAELGLFAVNFRELVRVRPFNGDGRPDPVAFGQIARVMRCRRSGRERPIDPRLVVLLADLQERLDARWLQLISGFRVPGHGHTSPTSFHVRGMAADVRAPGTRLWRLFRTAEVLGAGGVGLYPRRGDRFIHVDVRDEPLRWREKWNGRNATRRVRDRSAHEARMSAYPLGF